MRSTNFIRKYLSKKLLLNSLIFSFLHSFILFSSCKTSTTKPDASGTFEATETIIAAEATGVIRQLDVSEGQRLTAGTFLGYIDTTQLYLKKKQLLSQMRATQSQKPDISKQLAALQLQLKVAEREQNRLENLVKQNAATTKQLDDARSQVELIRKQIEALQSTLGITTESINQQSNPLMVQVEQIDDQLAKCKIVNTVNGTVLTKYAEANEMAAPGKPLYKIADLSSIILRAYITGNQLASVKLNQKVNVLVDDGNGKSKTYEGEITWISDKSEFTPKTIQTKDERANLVYAIKISVKNDGFLKIGMSAEVQLTMENR
jgi:HlyD family secretion protein